eukprot:8665857-Pyramimonas_sp.AAC.1
MQSSKRALSDTAAARVPSTDGWMILLPRPSARSLSWSSIGSMLKSPPMVRGAIMLCADAPTA